MTAFDRTSRWDLPDTFFLMQLSLAKNVPVYELRPMTPEEVDLLPPAVRGLIKVVPKA